MTILNACTKKFGNLLKATRTYIVNQTAGWNNKKFDAYTE